MPLFFFFFFFVLCSSTPVRQLLSTAGAAGAVATSQAGAGSWDRSQDLRLLRPLFLESPSATTDSKETLPYQSDWFISLAISHQRECPCQTAWECQLWILNISQLLLYVDVIRDNSLVPHFYDYFLLNMPSEIQIKLGTSVSDGCKHLALGTVLSFSPPKCEKL